MENLAFSLDNLLKGKVWTVITSLFLHADPLHLLGNMLFLYVFGNTIEEDLGPKKTVGAFFLGGVLSFLLSLFFYDPATPMIGASAAIFTLASIVMLLKPLKFSILLFMPQGLVAILYFVYNAIAVYYGSEGNVAYMAHIIGFAIGIPLGMAWSKEWFRNLMITIALLAVYAVIVFILFPLVLNLII
jgi:membrane associated rhomboid family serine protease